MTVPKPYRTQHSKSIPKTNIPCRRRITSASAGDIVLGQYRIILSADTASEVRQPPERCLSRQAGIVRCCLWNSVLWNAVFCTVSERSRPFPTERYIMCNERITCSVGRDTLIPPRRNLVGLRCACKPSVKLHKTNDLLFPRLFPNTIPKRPQFAAQCQIIPVGIYDQICLVQAELAAFVQQALVHIHGNDFSQKQVVAA